MLVDGSSIASKPLNIRESVARLILAGDDEARAASIELAAAGLWDAAIRLAIVWKVAAPLSQRIAGLALDPGPARALLRQMTTAAFVQSSRAARKGVSALQALQKAQIPAAAFKGLASIAGVYRSLAERFIGDADILVKREDLEAALTCLRAAGFQPHLPGEFSDYTSFMRQSPAFAGNLALALNDSEGNEIDLHWNLGISSGAVTIARLLERAKPATLFDTEIPIVSPADALILTSHHAVRENLAPDVTLRDVLDIQAWCLHLEAGGALAAALEQASSAGLAAPLLAIINIPLQFNPAGPLKSAATILTGLARKRDVETARQLTNLFIAQIARSSLNRDLPYLFRLASLRQIAASILSGWSTHRRFMEDMETRNLGRPLPISRRMGLFLGAALHLTPARIRELRALSRAKEAFQNNRT